MPLEQTEQFLNGRSQTLLNREEIKKRVRELGKEISEDYRGRCPILIGVLNGSFIFCADLFREITIDCEVDFLKISSYGDAMETSGTVKMVKDIDAHLKDRNVLVVEDIVDTGYSVNYLRERIAVMKPKSLKFVSLLVKMDAARVSAVVDYVGFNIPNEYVVGYGLDAAQRLRNLPEVYLMD